MEKKMKALRFYGRKDIRYEDVAEPSPAPGQVKIKINLAGICGTDLLRYAPGSDEILPNENPVIMGHEFAGKVITLGDGVRNFKVGDRVTGLSYWFCGQCYFCKKGKYNLCLNTAHIGGTVDGCMAEYMVAPTDSLYKLPDSVSDEAGVLVEPLAVAFRAVSQGNLHAGDTVAIIGDGPIGLCSLLAARATGASAVYMIAKHRGRGKLALDMGATVVIYPSDGNPVSSILNLTNDIGVDVSIECVGHGHAPLEWGVNLARKGGAFVLTGLFIEPVSFQFFPLSFYEKTMIGSSCYVNEMKTVIALLADGRIDPCRLITAKVPLNDGIKEGFEKLLTDKEKNIKILLQIP
jgi:(R,R)-butanediol dehydrogenase/meso-butanediol dehydrogenase/diacetyl reductase